MVHHSVQVPRQLLGAAEFRKVTMVLGPGVAMSYAAGLRGVRQSSYPAGGSASTYTAGGGKPLKEEA
jgi:hypothetical protein